MKKVMIAAIAGMLLAGCSSDNVEEQTSEQTTVKLTFSPYDVEPLTRTATSISNYCSHLDVWLGLCSEM